MINAVRGARKKITLFQGILGLVWFSISFVLGSEFFKKILLFRVVIQMLRRRSAMMNRQQSGLGGSGASEEGSYSHSRGP